MKKMLLAAGVALALPVGAQAQSLQYPGFYIGAEGGLNWLLNNTATSTVTFAGVPVGTANGQMNAAMGWAAGGMIGYDFVGPRVELEGLYRDNKMTVGPIGADFNQISVMGNVYYDFMAGSTIVPYIGAGAGVAFQNLYALNQSASSTQFAYQAMIGVGYNVSSLIRLNLEGRYFGTTTPNFQNSAGLIASTTSFPNNNLGVMASIQFKFGAPSEVAPPPAPAPAAAPSFMVFFDWDRSNLSAQALSTIKQAAGAFKTKGNARITATGHTDTSGPADYNMALSLRRANTVKDALVREGVPAAAIAVIGRGEQGLLVPTADGVREPQNRRVEIVLQ